MRNNLLFRLLGLSFIVAVFAITATAWLTTQGTSERLRGEFERTMEADAFVYYLIMSYAQEHDSWDDVDATLADLAERTGQRVALTTLTGDVIADSAGTASPELPPAPAAEIDAQSMLDVVVAGSAAVSVDLSPRWRMTDEELAERVDLAEEATACVQDTGGDAEVWLGPDGVIPVLPSEGAMPCVPDELYQPSAAVIEFSGRVTDLTDGCLEDAGIDVGHDNAEPGLIPGLPVVEPSNEHSAWVDCAQSVQADAMEPFVAEPALLYLGTADRFDPFSGDGWSRTALTGAAVLALASGVTLLAGRRLVRPIRDVTRAAQRMTAGDHTARVPVSGKDEVAHLGHAFNAMATSIASNDRQRRALVSDVAHELRTPLANVRGYLEAAEDEVVPLDRDLVVSLLEESTLLQRLVDDLQDLALADAGMLRLHPEETDAAELVRQVVASHRTRAGRAGVGVAVDAAGPLPISVDPVRLRQALGNLISNALQHTPAGGLVRVSARRSGDELVLAVIDTGPGIAAEHLPRLFDRFYRADASRSRTTGGSGLGLAITKHLAEAHGGSVEVASELGRGSTFSLRVPVG